MGVNSGGILQFRFKNRKLEVMLVHPGGTFWANRDEGAWSIPKGLIDENETVLADMPRLPLFGERRFSQLGVHGGQSEQELYVPLIVAP